ncbi:MAG: glycosyltransferase [Bacteroidetes bacterium]|nr:MAG: glycosyltransferase [Bacteroidota bacterium]
MSIDKISKPLLSICCMTYNHENYIRQCLDGLVMQKTSFPFEILVHEDASIDNTANIVKEYESKYPHLFRCVYQSENQFAKQNTLVNILFPMSSSKYIALCEGDDYWTDPNKLQKQVDFLEANPEYLLVYTDFESYNEFRNSLIPSSSNENSINKDGYIFEDLLKQNFIGTLTTVVRRSSILEAVDSIKQRNQAWGISDFPLWLEISLKGKIGYLRDSTAVYRLHGNSVSDHSNYIKSLKISLLVYTIRKYYFDSYPCSVETIKSIKKWHNKQLLEYCFLTQDRNYLSKSEIKNAFNELRSDKLYIGYRFHLYYLGAIFKFFKPVLKIVLKIFYPERLMSLRV